MKNKSRPVNKFSHTGKRHLTHGGAQGPRVILHYRNWRDVKWRNVITEKVIPSSFLIKTLLALQMMKKFATVNEPKSCEYICNAQNNETYARTKYNFCSDWKLNFKGTMNGLSTCARTRRSARVWVISFRCTICFFRIVLRAYIRDVSRFRTCNTYNVHVSNQRSTKIRRRSEPSRNCLYQ